MRKGFTLIELLVTIGVIAIMSAGVFVGYRGMSGRFELKTQSFKVLDVLNLARARTLASLGASTYGVHFEQTQFVLFRGASYDALSPDNVFYILPTSVEIADIALTGGGADVVFNRLTGATSQSGSLKVRLVSDISRLRTIEVLVSGRSDMTASALAPSGARIVDTRHVHVTYNQDARSAGTLTLTFPDGGPLVQNIDFQDNIIGGVFDWSGTVTVNGSPQVLRVHTHSMDASSAQFSVTRDLRYNTEALQLTLDGENLVNYSSAGAVTQGSSLWVAAPAAQ